MIDLVGKDSSGDDVLLSEYRGKVVVATFWATWCAPCRKELPVLGRAQTMLGSENLQVIAITHRDTRKNFKLMAKGMSEHPLLLTYDNKNKIGKAYGVDGIPYMLIIGRDGRIVKIHQGYSEESIRAVVGEIVELVQSGT